MTTAIMQQSTRIAVHVLIDDDSGAAAALILAVAALVNILVGVGHFVNEVILWAGVLVETAHLTNTVFVILFKSLAFGLLGVKL